MSARSESHLVGTRFLSNPATRRLRKGSKTKTLLRVAALANRRPRFRPPVEQSVVMPTFLALPMTTRSGPGASDRMRRANDSLTPRM